MNARHQTFELKLEGRQVQEAVSGIFHTLLFHRTLGKFHFKKEGSYSVGTIGFEDVSCDFIDFTYVRCSSEDLNKDLTNEVAAFSNALRSSEGQGGIQEGQISLEFFQKKRTRWPFPFESIPWEVWMLKINIINLPNEAERQKYRCLVGEVLADNVFAVAASMNRHEYVPKMPPQEDLDLVFDTSYKDVQPYLFKVAYQTTCSPASPSVGSTVRRLLKDTLAI